MPYRRRHKIRRPKKGRRGGRKGRSKMTLKVPRGVGFISPRFVTTLKYNEEVSVLGVLSGLTADYQFNLNSIFDPNFTGTGHQPYGHDTLQGIYYRYRVFKCSWVISMTCTDRLHAAVIPVNGAAIFTDASLAAEMPRAISKVFTPGGNSLMFKGRSYLPLLGGDKRTEYKSDDRFAALFGSNPLELMRLHIIIQNTSLVTISVPVNVTLVYHVECYDPIALAQS